MLNDNSLKMTVSYDSVVQFILFGKIHTEYDTSVLKLTLPLNYGLIPLKLVKSRALILKTKDKIITKKQL